MRTKWHIYTNNTLRKMIEGMCTLPSWRPFSLQVVNFLVALWRSQYIVRCVRGEPYTFCHDGHSVVKSALDRVRFSTSIVSSFNWFICHRSNWRGHRFGICTTHHLIFRSSPYFFFFITYGFTRIYIYTPLC